MPQFRNRTAPEARLLAASITSYNNHHSERDVQYPIMVSVIGISTERFSASLLAPEHGLIPIPKLSVMDIARNSLDHVVDQELRLPISQFGMVETYRLMMPEAPPYRSNSPFKDAPRTPASSVASPQQ